MSRTEKIGLNHTHPRIRKLLKDIVELTERHVKTPFKLYIFGSFATGKATYTSDLDIALETAEPLSKTDLLNLKDKIQSLRTLRKIDFIYLNTAPERVRKLVKKEGVLVYEFKG